MYVTSNICTLVFAKMNISVFAIQMHTHFSNAKEGKPAGTSLMVPGKKNCEHKRTALFAYIAFLKRTR